MKEPNKDFNKHCTKSTFYAMFEARGITLIALIITIVVLLVLAGITVANITGGDSVIDKAEQAKSETALSAKVEEVNNAIAMSMSSAFNEDLDMTKLQTNLGKLSGVTLSTNAFPANVEILGENYIIYSDGELFKGSAGSRRVPIPNGFVASQATGENDVTTGLVIYEGNDTVTDDNVATARTTRNQFVWVPVDGNAVKYDRDLTYKDTHQSVYKDYSDWEDSEGQSNVLSVAKYGGFYIGRYEAGWTEKNNGDTYETDKTTVFKNDTSRTPVCRKGYAGWNWITQANSKIVCKNMYKNNESVKSQLIDSYAWDATINWLNNTCSKVTSLINCKTYGNYSDNTSSIPANTLYALPIFSGIWLNPISYRKSDTAVDTSYRKKTVAQSDLINYTNDTVSGTSFSTRLELSTGASEDYNLNNVYDMAGNFWEWTTESGKHGSTLASATEYAVIRGGGFLNSGSTLPVVIRNGSNPSTSYAYLSIGFRPVLYLR